MIQNDHQNYLTQVQYTTLQMSLEELRNHSTESEPMSEVVREAQMFAIQSVMDDLRQEMEDYTRRLMER